MKQDEQDGSSESPMILFPEILGVAVMAIVTPVCLVKLFLSGHVIASIVGFVFWFTALFFTVRFIKRRQYFFAYLPMLAILGLYYFLQKVLAH